MQLCRDTLLNGLVLERLIDAEAQVIEVRLVHALTTRHGHHDLRVQRFQLGAYTGLQVGELGVELRRTTLPAATAATWLV